MFWGSYVALITPFRGGEVDEAAFQSIVEWHVEQGTHGLVPCGTTGESPTLSHAEHMRVTELCVEAAAGRIPVLAGTGSNSTDEAIMLTRHAKECGADGALVVTPYYNKPTQDGLYAHFKAINDAVADFPIVVYNIPGRSVVDLSVETMARLAELPGIVGTKDATNDLARPLATREAIEDQFSIMSGEDATAVALLAQGGDGCISVTANVAPRQLAEMHNAWRQGDFDTVFKINTRLYPLHVTLFAETSPSPVKYGASLLGLCEEEVRLPLVGIGAATRSSVENAMRSAGLLN
ncbi:MAG: 4-hydroxy-tetrahydrodipicolinate synthase [Alphaproteobacteria bacterium]|nr:4-hydroxy-tetrahydrodipicolinate synthase [Alphaproteobacteria bacterium]